MRKIVIALGLLLVSGMAALGANLSLLSGPQDPSQLNASINGVIRSINSTVSPNGTGTTGSAIYIPTVSGTAVNALAIYPGVTTQGVTITVGPSLGRSADTNADLNIVPRGSQGFLQFAGSFTNTGTVATTLVGANKGPTGSQTTIQEWLYVKNASGVTRYIPAW